MDNNNINQDNQNSNVPPRQQYQPAYYPIGAPPQKNPEEPPQYPVHIKSKKRNKPPRGIKGHTPLALPKMQKGKQGGANHSASGGHGGNEKFSVT